MSNSPQTQPKKDYLRRDLNPSLWRDQIAYFLKIQYTDAYTTQVLTGDEGQRVGQLNKVGAAVGACRRASRLQLRHQVAIGKLRTSFSLSHCLTLRDLFEPVSYSGLCLQSFFCPYLSSSSGHM